MTDGARPGDAVGPGPMPDALLRALDLSLRRRVSGLLPGEHRSYGTGEGSELALIRPYRAGDDVRAIDWNVTARTGEPHVRERIAEKVLTTWVAIDVSASMMFGTADRRKWDVAEGAAIVLAHLGGRRGNRVGVMPFGGDRERIFPPQGGRAGVLAALSALRAEPPKEHAGAGSLGDAIARVSRVARKGSLVAIVSDVRGPKDWRQELGQLASRCEVFVVEIRDPREQELVPVGHLWLVDPETGRDLVVNTSNRKLRERFARAAAEERDAVGTAIRRAGAGHVVLSTQGDWLRSMASFLHRTKLRGWRSA